jgi:hypothetical protein
MHLSDDPRELQRQIELASRIASSVTDQTTVERLRGIPALRAALFDERDRCRS